MTNLILFNQNMVRKYRVYLSAPMTNNQDGYEAHFEELKELARRYFSPYLASGEYDELIIVNPTKLSHQLIRSKAEYMKECIAALAECNAVVFGTGWSESKGCQQEYRTANDWLIETFFEEELNTQK